MWLRYMGVRLHEDTYEKIENMANSRGESVSSVVRELIERGLTFELGDNQINDIAVIIREQLEAVLQPQIERLAKLSAKGGVMSAAAAYLSAQALMDFVPDEKRRDAKEAFEKAKAKGASYIKEK